MTKQIFLMWGGLLSLPAMLTANCIPATSARITAGDLARADERFKLLPAVQVIGFAPEPGVRRTFAVAELERIAKRYSLPTEGLTELCAEVPQRRVGVAELVEAMRSELPEKAELKIVEAQDAMQPEGKLVFPKAGLEPPTQDGVQLWRGHIQYAETKKASIWARVQVTQDVEVVVAKKDLPANTPIVAEALSLEKRSLPLSKDQLVIRIEQVAGKTAKQAIKAGSVLVASLIESSLAVKRGDAVRVEVQSGTTKLFFEAVAERQGHDGEFIELRNPSSGKLFRAKISGAKAVIKL